MATPAIEDFDIVVLGSGEGAKNIGWTFGKLGKRVAIIERQWIGGSCPNIACLPSKNIIHSAKVASYLKRAKEFGLDVPSYQVNMAGVRERKRQMVSGLVDVHLANFKKSNDELIMGTGRFVGERLIEVTLNDGGTRLLRGENVVIGTGSHATVDPIPGLREAAPMTHVEALELDVVPSRLIVLGGGYIGLEMAQMFRRLGSAVTVVDRNERLLPREDTDVVEVLNGAFDAEGIERLLSASPVKVSGRSGQSVEVTVSTKAGERVLRGSHLLVAAGRTPNTHELSLEKAGVTVTDRGFVQVDARLATTAPGVWAMGDVAGSPQFTHLALDDFRVVRDNLLGKTRVTTGRLVPFCLFTDPEFARVGLSEVEASAAKKPYRLFKIPLAADLRTRTLSETRGFLKALVAVDSDQILGFTMVGPDAGEVMGAVQIAMLGKLPYTVLRDAVLTHPTLVEGLNVVFGAAPTTVTP